MLLRDHVIGIEFMDGVGMYYQIVCFLHHRHIFEYFLYVCYFLIIRLYLQLIVQNEAKEHGVHRSNDRY